MEKLKNLSSTAKIVIAVILAVVIIAASVGGVFLSKYKNAPEVVLADVVFGNVSQNYSTTAQIKSKDKTVYEALDGVVVKTVEVKVGDVVQEGTVLATFDTSALGDPLESKRKSWQTAKTAYEEAVQSAKDAEVDLPKIEKQIEELEKQIEENKTAVTDAPTTAPAVTEPPKSSSSGGLLDSVISSITGGSGTLSQLNQLLDALNGGDITSMINADQISDLLNSSMGGISEQSQLVQLQAQKAVYGLITSETYLNARKEQMEKAEKTYNVYKAAMNMLSEGWVADCYGIVSEVNIEAGKTYTNETEASGGLDFSSLSGLLDGSGDYSALINAIAGFSSSANDNGAMVIQHYNNLYLDFSIGKYDLQNVKLNQKATIKYLDNIYSGTVTYIGAVATESTGLDISSMVGSLTGGGGSSTGADTTVTIDNPDSGIVIGFDADVTIETGRAENVLTIPVECLKVLNGERFVYVYDSKTKQIESRSVTVGLAGDDTYEIKEGLQEGDKIVKVFKGTGITVEDGMRVRSVAK